jgi:hypothetical protein
MPTTQQLAIVALVQMSPELALGIAFVVVAIMVFLIVVRQL